jgi:8-oxo-dGTP diphosphatase
MKHLGKIRSMASVYLRRDNKLLLLYRQGSSIVSNLWIGSAGGHFEEYELADARACVLRELFEELAIKEEVLENLSLRYVTIRYADNELRQNYYFFADLLDEQIQTPNSTEGITQWFSFEETGNLPMPFTAKYVVDHYIQTGQYSDTLYGGIANEDGVDFKIL